MMLASVTLQFRRALAATVLTFSALTACGAPPAQVDGIHLHKKGTSPSLAKIATVQFKASKDQCELMIKFCQQGLGNAALCDAAAGGFKSNGDPATVGNFESDEYFSPQNNMSMQKKTAWVMLHKATCEVDISEMTTIKIRHFQANNRVQYELKKNKKKGEYWQRSVHKSLDAKSAKFLVGVFPLTASTSVSPVLQTKKYAGHNCEVRSLSGPLSGTSCLKATGLPFPEHIALAGTLLSGKEVLSDDEVTQVELNVSLPVSMFYPPSNAKVEDLESAATSPNNATQKWCLVQKAKTGINPCADESNGND